MAQSEWQARVHVELLKDSPLVHCEEDARVLGGSGTQRDQDIALFIVAEAVGHWVASRGS